MSMHLPQLIDMIDGNNVLEELVILLSLRRLLHCFQIGF